MAFAFLKTKTNRKQYNPQNLHNPEIIEKHNQILKVRKNYLDKSTQCLLLVEKTFLLKETSEILTIWTRLGFINLQFELGINLKQILHFM